MFRSALNRHIPSLRAPSSLEFIVDHGEHILVHSHQDSALTARFLFTSLNRSLFRLLLCPKKRLFNLLPARCSPLPAPLIPFLCIIIYTTRQSMNIDKPLDELVAANRKVRQPRVQKPRAPQNNNNTNNGANQGGRAAQQQNGAGGARARYAGNAPMNNGQQLPAARAAAGAPLPGDKIIVSNLPDDVSETMIKVRLSTGLPHVPPCQCTEERKKKGSCQFRRII